MTDQLITVAQVRQVLKRQGGRPICVPGIRAWCKRHGLDFAQLSAPGLPASTFRAIDDHFARTLLERIGGGDGQQ